jgi:apolipoprotein N-acyltransferase
MIASSKALIVQTNSATFSGTAESRQQLAITRIRAKEHSRSILSVSTIGISAFIDSNGEVVKQSDENIETFLMGDLSLNNHVTNATKWGALNKILILALLSVFGLISLRKKSSL